jgi:hypothetical protein
MMDYSKIIADAEKNALSEIKKYGAPSLLNFQTSNQKGLWIAKKMKADQNIVQLGTRLMDVKLGEALREGKLAEHVERSSAWARQFMEKYALPVNVQEKVINCIEGHHGKIPWKCKEAEICANADCYRFLLVKNWLDFFGDLRAEGNTYQDTMQLGEEKLEEKWKVISLDICKKELEPHYKLIQQIIAKTKESSASAV